MPTSHRSRASMKSLACGVARWKRVGPIHGRSALEQPVTGRCTKPSSAVNSVPLLLHGAAESAGVRLKVC